MRSVRQRWDKGIFQMHDANGREGGAEGIEGCLTHCAPNIL